MDLDDKDRLLLQLLTADARAPILALARKLQLSRSATQARVQRLVKNGTIRRFTVETAEPRQLAAHVLVRFAAGKKCADVVPRLRLVPGVVLIHSVAGLNDLVVRLEAADMAALEAGRAEIAAIHGVAEVTTLVTLERHAG